VVGRAGALGGPGPFVSVVARYRAGKSRADVSELLDRLLAIPPAAVRELAIETARKLVLPADERARLADAVARFDQLEHVSVPWDAPAPQQPASERGLELSLSLWGTGLLDPDRLDAVWQLIEQLGERYDSFQLNSKPTLRTLEGLNHVKKWAVNPGTRRLELRRDGHPGSLSLSRPALDAFTHLDVALGARSRESFVAWVLQLLELAPFFMGACFLTRGRPSAETFQIGHSGQRAPVVGWLVVFGGRYVPVLPAIEVAALAARPSLEGLFVEQTTHNLVVGVARSPEQRTERPALADGCARSSTANEVRFDPVSARVRAILGPPPAARADRAARADTTTPCSCWPVGIERRGDAVEHADHAEPLGDAREPSPTPFITARSVHRAQPVLYTCQQLDGATEGRQPHASARSPGSPSRPRAVEQPRRSLSDHAPKIADHDGRRTAGCEHGIDSKEPCS
jgi:hypothetical protein